MFSGEQYSWLNWVQRCTGCLHCICVLAGTCVTCFPVPLRSQLPPGTTALIYPTAIYAPT